jgi:hypothetical protein
MTTPHEHNSEGRTSHVLPRHQGLRETGTENRAYFRPNRLGARALHARFSSVNMCGQRTAQYPMPTDIVR